MDISKLINIAKETGQTDLQKKLEEIATTMKMENAPLFLPLVGEFSSGKTTLINALTDSKKLEVATVPTTATIYEIFFGAEQCSATVVKKDGTTEEISDIAELKNDRLTNSLIVDVFDTSKKIPSSTILVDTPGLSSSDPRHKAALVNFLPKADGVLLVTDINQQITKSLTDFAKNIELSNRPMYLIVTKCDTKSKSEINEVREYIQKNTKLNIKGMAFVSAQNEDMQELYVLLSQIDADKSKILKAVNESRINNIAKMLSERIEELLNASELDDSFDDEMDKTKRELEQIQRNIESLIDDAQAKTSEIKDDTCRIFEETVADRLERIAVSKSANFDGEAAAAVGGIASQCLCNFKMHIQEKLFSLAKERRNGDSELNLLSLNEIDFNSLNIAKLPYNMNLNELGHEYDGIITGAAKVLAVGGLVVGTVATAGAFGIGAAGAGAAAAGTGAAAGGAAIGAGTAIGSGVASSVDAIVTAVAINKVNKANNKAREEEIRRLQTQIQQTSQEFETYNRTVGANIGMKKGLVEGLVAKITDSASGKPQRQKAIHTYIYDVLIPEFKNQMEVLCSSLISTIRTSLMKEAQSLIEQKRATLSDLKNKKEKELAIFNAHIDCLRNYKKQLENA